MLVNSLPLIELSLRTDADQAHMWTVSAEDTLDDYAYANGHTVQEMQVQIQATLTAELDTGSSSASYRLARGCGKRIISRPAFPTDVNAPDAALMASDKEGLNIYVNTAYPAYKCNLVFVLF